jgi:rhodanese-related sulfurtransferase
MKSISPQEAKTLLENGSGAIYLDVRSQAEFAQGHAPGAWNVPILDLDASGRMTPNQEFVGVVETHFSKDATIIVGCKSGPRSERAVQIMTEVGYTRAINLAGGFCGQTDFFGNVVEPGWTTLALPVATAPEPGRSYSQLRNRAEPRP